MCKSKKNQYQFYTRNQNDFAERVSPHFVKFSIFPLSGNLKISKPKCNIFHRNKTSSKPNS